MKNFLFLFLLFLSINPFTCTEENVTASSAKLDKLLIPIMYHVELGNFAEAKTTVIMLERKWKINKGHLKTIEDYSEEFGTLPNYVEGKIKELSLAVDAKDEKRSMWVFEEIQCALSDWRTDQKVEYYLDDWYKFKYDVDIFTDIAKDELLDLCEWEDLQWHYDYIEDRFYFLSTSVSDLEHFDVEEELFFQELVNINNTFHGLRKAMDSGQREEVEEMAYVLQKDILMAMILFGDFTDTMATL